MINSKYHILWLFLSCPFFFYGQIKVSDHIQKSAIAEEENSLYFVDFWATWCGPCIHVSKYLTTLQEAFPNDLHIMSLTQENPNLVERFLKKHPTDLAVAIDYQGETFKKYTIRSLPYGMLFNANGEKLWEGHPADFKAEDVRYFLKKNRKNRAVDEMYLLQQEKTIRIEEKELKKDIELVRLSSATDFQVLKKKNYTELSGSLQKLLAYIYNTYEKQLVIPEDLNLYYMVRIKSQVFGSEELPNRMLASLGLKMQPSSQKGDILLFSTTNAQFWDTDQIDWGNDTPNFLIGDNDVKADNVSLVQLAYQLSTLLKIPIVIQENTNTKTLHDWSIHYRFFQLMVSDFQDNYGIKVEKKVATYPTYNITKKAP